MALGHMMSNEKWPRATTRVNMSDDVPVHALDKFVLRLPPGMRDQIGAAARVNRRTMNAEIVSRLEGTFSDAEQAKIAATSSSIEADTIGLRDQFRLVIDEIADLRALLIGREPRVPDFTTRRKRARDHKS
jgi:hypothetical protein